jgi:hypothetical protein
MKVLCPVCKQIINLAYLEKKGDQTAYCARCDVTVSASFKKDKDRRYWEVYFEKPIYKDKPPGCLKPILIAIALFLLLMLIAMRRCDLQVSDQPPDRTIERPLQN